MNRRYFLKGASVVAILCATPDLVSAGLIHRSAQTAFNNGKTQIQSTVPSLSGDFPFINLVKIGDVWRGTGTDNSGAAIDPSWLDANGYPLQSAMSRDAFGVIMVTTLPAQSSRVSNAGNPMVITWEGNSSVFVGNAASTFVSGSNSAVLNGYGFSDGLYHGRYVWYPTYDASGNYSFQLNLRTITVGSYCNKLQLFFSDDEVSLLAGNIFGTKYKQILQQANPGVFRIMDWFLTNISTTTTWASRKSFNYPAWSADEFRAALYPGDIMTNSGAAYAMTNGSFTFADKLTMHVHFNADGTISINTASGFSIAGSPQTLTAALTPQLTVTWASHPLVNNQIVGALFNGNAPTGMQTGVNYYVVNATTNTFQLALTSGGTAIAPASLNGGGLGILTMSTLSLNGSSVIPIRDRGGSPLLEAPASTDGGGKKIYGTVVYDADLNCWMMSGATKNTFSSGLQNGIPIEVSMRLCKEIGMHPSLSIPYLALDPMTDFVPNLATEIKNNWPSWMIPRFEPGNEVWNVLTPITNYANSKAWVHWQSDLQDWYGKVLSTMGQAAAAVYGQGNLGATYEVMCGVQVDGMTFPLANPSGVDPRLTAAAYVAQAAAPQVGYTKSAASGWASAVLPSSYISPGMRGTYLEWQTAFDWAFTSIGNPTQQAIDLNAYVDTLIGVNTGFTIPYLSARWHGSKDWASRFSVNKMFAYEGGYSPDLMPSFYDFSSPLLSVFQSSPAAPVPTKATQCVIQIHNPANREGFPQETGNPAVAGMLVALAAVSGMTQLNCGSGSATFSNSVPDVTWTAHNLNINQAVVFKGASLPSNVTASQRYFVISTNLTTNTFQFSATRGGAAIQPNAAGSGSVYSAFVVVSAAGDATTIDVNSTGFPTATSPPFVNFPASQTIINSFRIATLLFATHLQARMTDSFNEFAAQGGLFPSQYEVSGTGAIWPPIQPDIYGAQGGELAAIIAYNH